LAGIVFVLAAVTNKDVGHSSLNILCIRQGIIAETQGTCTGENEVG
jgi:hypothetical protein